MPNVLTSVQQQALFVVPGSELPSAPTRMTVQNAPVPTTYASSRLTGVSNDVGGTPRTESRVLRETLSSVAVIWQSELNQQYRELGEALSELSELEEGNEWKIETQVYQVACDVASELMTLSYPAPRVFTHGPESVVFNWTHGTNNLYLTISSDSVSALVSTPKRIERRLDFEARQFLASPLLLPAIRSVQLDTQSVLISRAGSGPLEFVD